MRVLLYVFGFWGGWAVGIFLAVALYGKDAGESVLPLGLIGSGVGIWLVRRTREKEAGPHGSAQPPQTAYTDNRTIDNRKVFHIVANDKEEAARIMRQVEQQDSEHEQEAIDMDAVRHKLLEKK